MAQLTFPIVSGELALTVLVNVGTQRARDLLALAQPLPSGVWGTAVIDTASTLTCVSRPVLQQFGLTPVGQGSSQTAAGLMLVDIYRISLSIPPHQNLPGPILTSADMNVMELAAPIPGVDVLIGMDLLLTIKATIDGPLGQFTLEF